MRTISNNVFCNEFIISELLTFFLDFKIYCENIALLRASFLPFDYWQVAIGITKFLNICLEKSYLGRYQCIISSVGRSICIFFSFSIFLQPETNKNKFAYIASPPVYTSGQEACVRKDWEGGREGEALGPSPSLADCKLGAYAVF